MVNSHSGCPLHAQCDGGKVAGGDCRHIDGRSAFCHSFCLGGKTTSCCHLTGVASSTLDLSVGGSRASRARTIRPLDAEKRPLVDGLQASAAYGGTKVAGLLALRQQVSLPTTLGHPGSMSVSMFRDFTAVWCLLYTIVTSEPRFTTGAFFLKHSRMIPMNVNLTGLEIFRIIIVILQLGATFIAVIYPLFIYFGVSIDKRDIGGHVEFKALCPDLFRSVHLYNNTIDDVPHALGGRCRGC